MTKYIQMKFLTTAILFLLALPSIAQETKDISLSEAIELTLKNNYQIQISQKNLEIAQIDNSWGNAGRYPTLTASFSNRNRYDNVEATGGSRMELTTLGLYPSLAFQWNLFNGWQVDITKENLQILEEMTQGNTTILIENTIQDIILAYYQTLLQQEKLKVAEEVMKLSKDRYDYMLMKKDLGTSVTFDVLQVKTAFLTDSANFLMQKVNFSNSLKYMNYLLGDTTQTEYNLTEEFAAKEENYEFLALREKTLSNNSTLKNQYLNQKILENSVQLSKSSDYPRLTLSAGTDYMKPWTFFMGDGTSSTEYSYDFYANLTLSYSIYTGGAKKRAKAKAFISQDIGNTSLTEMQHRIENDLYRTNDLYNLKKQLYQVSLEAEQSAALNLEIGIEKFKNGSINSFNLRDLTIYYMNAANQRLESIYNLMESYTDLLRISGGIIESKE